MKEKIQSEIEKSLVILHDKVTGKRINKRIRIFKCGKKINWISRQINA